VSCADADRLCAAGSPCAGRGGWGGLLAHGAARQPVCLAPPPPCATSLAPRTAHTHTHTHTTHTRTQARRAPVAAGDAHAHD
jgi:hypothetical protein